MNRMSVRDLVVGLPYYLHDRREVLLVVESIERLGSNHLRVTWCMTREGVRGTKQDDVRLDTQWYVTPCYLLDDPYVIEELDLV